MKVLKDNYILCIETTSEICGVSVGNGSDLIRKSDLNVGLNHSITLFNNIKNLMLDTNIDFSNIKKIKVSAGPGSFTGIRIGIATAIGLSKKHNTQIEYIDTLDSLSKIFSVDENYIISMIDAKVERVYFSVYQNNHCKKIIDDSIINIIDLISILNKYFLTKNVSFALLGNGATNYKNIFDDNLKINYRIYDNSSLLSSDSLLKVDGVVSNLPISNYLLASKAERDRYGRS